MTNAAPSQVKQGFELPTWAKIILIITGSISFWIAVVGIFVVFTQPHLWFMPIAATAYFAFALFGILRL